jgi:hypothetical protein
LLNYGIKQGSFENVIGDFVDPIGASGIFGFKFRVPFYQLFFKKIYFFDIQVGLCPENSFHSIIKVLDAKESKMIGRFSIPDMAAGDSPHVSIRETGFVVS